MTTSGTFAFNPSRDQLVRSALRIVGAYSASDSPRPEQMADAIEALDMMLKGWQMDGMLWLKQFIYVTLTAAKASYVIGPNSTDTVSTSATATVAYAQRPTRVFFPTRRTIATGYEVPLAPLSRQEYAALVNKTVQGVPVQVYYDAQITDGTLYVWPVPPAAGYQVALTVDRIIMDTGADDSTMDVPPEFIETVKYNLALRISSEYPPGMGADDKQLALALYDKMSGFQRDNASTFFQPGR